MSAITGEANLANACALVDELALRGVRHAVVCPGSRSTPVAVALSAHTNVKTWVHVDERSAAFFALGMARQCDEPVAILTTSGTAAANLYPAVAEAHLSRIPLLALTADRPPEMRDWGAAQAIDQYRIFGSHVKWFADLPVPDAVALARQARAVAARAVETAWSDPAGPVHLNLPFREPLLPSDMRPPLRLESLFAHGRAQASSQGRPRTHRLADQPLIADLAALARSELRGIVVCGPGESPHLAEAVTQFSHATGFPILADALSGVRFGHHDRSHVVDAHDAFLRDEKIVEQLAPDVVVRTGAWPTSKPLQLFLADHPGHHHILIDPGDPRDPSHLVTDHVRADPAATLSAIAEMTSGNPLTASCRWTETWLTVDRTTQETINQALVRDDRPFEGRAASELAACLPDGATLVVGNSMPVRDVDAFVRGDARQLRIVANRGANGIDGVVSSALGAAAVSDGPVVLLIGDLSFFHDMNGLLASRLFGIDATIVILNNNGGGIFSFLPQSEQLDAETFELLFGTPAGVDVATIAELYGASFARPGDWSTFRRDVCQGLTSSGLSIVELVTDRQQNVAQHRAIWSAVSESLREGTGRLT